jgi:hypothetical protein
MLHGRVRRHGFAKALDGNRVRYYHERRAAEVLAGRQSSDASVCGDDPRPPSSLSELAEIELGLCGDRCANAGRRDHRRRGV